MPAKLIKLAFRNISYTLIVGRAQALTAPAQSEALLGVKAVVHRKGKPGSSLVNCSL